MHVVVIRGTKALAKPQEDGEPVPEIQEIEDFITMIDYQDFHGVRIVNASSGAAPDGWRWVSLIQLQNESAFAEMIGEALLCT